jgi:hypothetical protein
MKAGGLAILPKPPSKLCQRLKSGYTFDFDELINRCGLVKLHIEAAYDSRGVAKVKST